MKLATENELWSYFWKHGLDPTLRSFGPGRSATSRRFEGSLFVPDPNDDRTRIQFSGVGYRRDVALRRLLNELARAGVVPALSARLQDVPALAHGTGWTTEHDSARALGDLSPSLLEVLWALHDGGPATDRTLTERVPRYAHDGGVRKRRSKLMSLGMVEPLRAGIGDREGEVVTVRNSETGRNVIVWTVSPEGRDYLEPRLVEGDLR